MWQKRKATQWLEKNSNSTRKLYVSYLDVRKWNQSNVFFFNRSCTWKTSCLDLLLSLFYLLLRPNIQPLFIYSLSKPHPALHSRTPPRSIVPSFPPAIRLSLTVPVLPASPVIFSLLLRSNRRPSHHQKLQVYAAAGSQRLPSPSNFKPQLKRRIQQRRGK